MKFLSYTKIVAKSAVALVVAGLGLFTFATPALAVPPTNFQTQQIIGTGLNGPSGFGTAPDGRIFILERAGKVKIYKNGTLLAQPFVDLPSEASGDRGLIGVAFDPDFATNHFVYFYYTGTDLLNRLVRLDASADVATAPPTIIYQTTFLSYQLHVGGSIGFGPDGKLYLAVGDNGTPTNAQDLSNPHGKILRINKDGSIPTDNPFFGQAGKLGEIWAYGLRNLWRFQFDSVTGMLYDGDVGDYTSEEINHIVKGQNYGWPLKEGRCASNCAGFTDPIYTYYHDNTSSAITDGPVYRGTLFPSEYQGRLFFGDYAKGFIKTLTLDGLGNSTGVQDFDLQAGSVVDLKVALDGSLYYITYYPGRLYRVSYSVGNHAPIAQASADATRGTQPLTVHFSSAGTTDPDNDPLSYKWNFGDGTTSTEANPTKIYNTKGTYTAELTVSDASNSSNAKPLVIQVGIPPVVTIGTPKDGANYRAGDLINYTISAVDGAGFDINDGALSTEIIFHHGTHTHPFLGPLVGRTGSFRTPVIGEESAQTWFEIKATATDTSGIATTISNNIYPVTSTFTLNTNPLGLQTLIDGVPATTARDITGVVGFQRQLSAPATQILAGKTYAFTGWSDGGLATHGITTPETATTYTANYKEVSGFVGEYYANKTLTGNPTLTRTDGAVDFDWGNGSPDPTIPSDNFSARWTKTEAFTSGNYDFTVTADDGVRLFIDGALVLDKWTDQAATTYIAHQGLGAGNHTIVMEYYERGGNAVAKLQYNKTTDTTPNPTPVPANGQRITISAAGTAAAGVYPEMHLLVDNANVATFKDVRGNAQSRVFQKFTYDSPVPLTADKIKISFVNDLSANGEDRNLLIDNIMLGDTTYQTEDASTYSTGTWNQASGCAPGNKQSEWLHCNGSITYSAGIPPVATHSLVKIYAAGQPAEGIYPTMQLVIDGTVVATYTDIRGDVQGRVFQEFTYTAPTLLTNEQIVVRFTNDATTATEDRNLRIDRITVDGVTTETEASTNYSLGSWTPDTGCGGGNKQSEWLNCTGEVRYSR